MQKNKTSFSHVKSFLNLMFVIIGSAGMTACFFLVLPVMQQLTAPPENDLALQSFDTAKLEAPEPPPEPEPEEEPEEEPEPPQLDTEAPPLDLAQLELALNPGVSGGWMQGDFAVRLNNIVGGGKNDDVDALFSIADLDQKPRVVYQASPVLSASVRKKAPGKVYIVFVVDQKGKVVDPKIQTASDPIFEKPALAAVKQWKFEPGKRGGKPVRFRMRVPIIFPK